MSICSFEMKVKKCPSEKKVNLKLNSLETRKPEHTFSHQRKKNRETFGYDLNI